ncbi:hypothetical protein QEH59_15425 [Coraliomargarita sp. SDUM461004]|uniref:Uncharacterized protein n=1 Tax=Thalassobacterium sedimentorum TaxID=3041258 RepID=A0ABU1AM12_9BACT|nr:hypothetical protein [Coraliomargarita sp. SDUM461004]MDQ8195823.1 hypothetical protein [Coraliomargarita sp. SDUM461004]
MKNLISSATCLLALAHSMPAAQSVSSGGDYTLLHAPAGDANGGGQVSSASQSIVAQVTVGDMFSGGVSHVTVSDFQSKHNFTGQLYDVKSIEVSASSTTVDEGSTGQISAIATYDDATTLSLAGTTGTQWGIETGIAAIDISTGTITADTVYEDVLTTVEVTREGVVGALPLTILNIDVDNFAQYGGDAIDDDWQVHYFGLPPNANAAPDANFDNDPHDNYFEFLSGFDPTDAADFFQVTVEGFTAESTLAIKLNKVIPGRLYTVKSSPDLGQSVPFATTESPFLVVDEAVDHVFEDTDATLEAKFYTVEISLP